MDTQDATTKTPTEPGHDKLKTRLDELKQMRDEIRLKIHLAGMDARDTFKKIEPAVDRAEHEVTHMAQGAADAVAKTLDAVANSLRLIRDRMPKQG